MSLTPKAIHTIYSRPNDRSLQPILQVLSVSTLAGQTGRFKIVLSDGEMYSTGLLSSQIISRYGGCPFKPYQLVSLEEYVVNAVQEKVFLLVHNMTEVSPPLAAGQIGNPQVYRPNPSVPSPAAPAVPPPVSVNPYASPSPFQALQTSTFVNPHNQALPSHSPFAVGMAQPVQQQQAYQGQTAGPVRYLQSTEVLTPMNQLTIYTQKWSIKARVSTKSEMRHFRNAKGEGQLMTVDLVDQNQTEMRATFFGSAAMKFHPILSVGKVYTFSKGSVKPANPRFNPKAQYELMFDEFSEISLSGEDASIPAMKVSLIRIQDVAETPVGENVDVIGIVTAIGEISAVTIKSTGRDTTKRTITIADESKSLVDVTVWGDKAERIGEELKGKSVLLAKNCRVGEYNGKSLSTSGSSLLEADPSHPRTNELKTWWLSAAHSVSSFSSLSSIGNVGAASSNSSSFKRVTIQAMRSEDVSTLGASFGRNVNSHLVKATLIHVPMRDGAPLFYKSCPTEVEDGRGGRRLCQKKCELQSDTNMYLCAEQHANRSASARFILSMRIQDASGECLVRAFHDQAKAVLGVDASDLDSASDVAAAQAAVVEAALFKPFLIKIRSKKEVHMDEEKLNMVVADASIPSPHAEAAHMLGNIKHYLSRIAAC